MKKLWVALALLIAVLMFWLLGGVDYFLARTVFAPNADPVVILPDPTPAEPGEAVPGEEVPGAEERGEVQYEIDVFGENLEAPWEIVFLPDGTMLSTERPGHVFMLGKGRIATLPNVAASGEGGLLGMALSPDFVSDRFLYLYYTYREGGRILNRVSRFTFENETLTGETVILDRIPGANFHNGGRIKFGPDGKLYVTTGDAQETSLSQNLNSLAGKILRMNPEGSVPQDNPFPGSLVYAYGLRNPQGLAWHPETGALYASDHGPTSQDEINLILPGRNYGWPVATCNQPDERFESPIVCYVEFTMAPSGIGFLKGNRPEDTALFVSGLRGNVVMKLELNEDGGLKRQSPLLSDYGRIRTVVEEDGALYVATNNRDGRGVPRSGDDKILKITPIWP